MMPFLQFYPNEFMKFILGLRKLQGMFIFS